MALFILQMHDASGHIYNSPETTKENESCGIRNLVLIYVLVHLITYTKMAIISNKSGQIDELLYS